MIVAHKEHQDAADAPVTPRIDPRALFLWGRLLDAYPKGLLDAMLDHMRTTTLEMAPKVRGWLSSPPAPKLAEQQRRIGCQKQQRVSGDCDKHRGVGLHVQQR